MNGLCSALVVLDEAHAQARAEPDAVPCLESRTLRTASAFASGGMLRTDVCTRPRGHKGEHRA